MVLGGSLCPHRVAGPLAAFVLWLGGRVCAFSFQNLTFSDFERCWSLFERFFGFFRGRRFCSAFLLAFFPRSRLFAPVPFSATLSPFCASSSFSPLWGPFFAFEASLEVRFSVRLLFLAPLGSRLLFSVPSLGLWSFPAPFFLVVVPFLVPLGVLGSLFCLRSVPFLLF